RQHLVDKPHGAVLPDRQRSERVGERDRVLERQYGQRGGKRRTKLQLVDLATGLGDVDAHVGSPLRGPMPLRTGMLRTCSSGRTPGTSTRRIPLSYVARARSASTSVPSSISRLNGPCSISTCW